MSEENNFDNYLATDELKTLLTYVKKKEPGEPFLIFTANDSGDGMVTGEASTWMQISSARTDMIC